MTDRCTCEEPFPSPCNLTPCPKPWEHHSRIYRCPKAVKEWWNERR